MECLDLLFQRRSIRKYKHQDIPDDILKLILNAARLAPSAHNRQPWHFIVVKDRALRKELSQWRWSKFLIEAPVVIVGCGNPMKSSKYWMIDVAIALQNLVIAATLLGLGTCWIGDFKEEIVKELLRIPNEWRVVALIAVGYPDESPESPRKKPLSIITSLNYFGNPFMEK